ncbi:MAG TPA: hypothetical protein VLG46_09530, partial [Anaerolineae bacterium]|nr:hypothetical protein [Anaerolineae bacterium]
MKQTQLIILISITLGAIFATLFVNRPQLTRAAPNSGVVGTGTPASCTEAALRTALAGGGSVTFNCGSSVATITLTQQIVVTSTTSMNGLPNGIILSGGNTTRLFHVQSGVLYLHEINLRNGNANGGNGGVALVEVGAGLDIYSGIHGGNQASFGGVVSNFGTLTMTYGLYFFNHATINGGVLDNVGTATL